jgi:hypothetical protein
VLRFGIHLLATRLENKLRGNLVPVVNARYELPPVKCLVGNELKNIPVGFQAKPPLPLSGRVSHLYCRQMGPRIKYDRPADDPTRVPRFNQTRNRAMPVY